MFIQHGYFKEYYINNKYIGTVNNVEKDRDVMGFFGSKTETISETITLSNKKTIKPNTTVTTQLQFLNGKKI